MKENAKFLNKKLKNSKKKKKLLKLFLNISQNNKNKYNNLSYINV